MISMIRSQKGFTLVELLVAIGIIGILATVTTVSVSSIRAKGRDTKRVTDIKAIQANLEIFAETNGGYPEDGATTAVPIEEQWLCNADTIEAAKTKGFKPATECADTTKQIFKVPKNPSPGGTIYKYKGNTVAATKWQTYEVFFTLEGDSGSFKKGCNVATDKEIKTVTTGC